MHVCMMVTWFLITLKCVKTLEGEKKVNVNALCWCVVFFFPLLNDQTIMFSIIWSQSQIIHSSILVNKNISGHAESPFKTQTQHVMWVNTLSKIKNCQSVCWCSMICSFGVENAMCACSTDVIDRCEVKQINSGTSCYMFLLIDTKRKEDAHFPWLMYRRSLFDRT